MSNFAPQVPKSLIDAVSSVMKESKIDDLKDKKDVEKASDPLAGYKEKEKKEPVKKVTGKYGKEDEKEVDESLIGNQKKLDKNHNGKLDSEIGRAHV